VRGGDAGLIADEEQHVTVARAYAGADRRGHPLLRLRVLHDRDVEPAQRVANRRSIARDDHDRRRHLRRHASGAADQRLAAGLEQLFRAAEAAREAGRQDDGVQAHATTRGS
jgi:hypothetical protein